MLNHQHYDSYEPQLYYKVEVPEADGPCIHQARLPPDDESSFSSLDSEIVTKQYGGRKYEAEPAISIHRKYNYLNDAGKPMSPIEHNHRAATHSLSQGKSAHRSNSNYEFTLQNSNRDKEDRQRRIDELLTENEVLRGQLKCLKDTNINIEQEVKKGSDELKRMRKQLNRNMSQQHHAQGMSLQIEETLREQLQSAQSKVKQLQQDLSLSSRKYEHEKEKNIGLQAQIKSLKRSLRSKQSKVEELANNESLGIRVSEEDFKRQARYIRKIQTRLKEVNQTLEEQRESYNKVLEQYRQVTETRQVEEPTVHWKDNFIKVFVDMLRRLAIRENFSFRSGLSLKKQTKLSWRYLKKFINNHYKDEVAAASGEQ